MKNKIQFNIVLVSIILMTIACGGGGDDSPSNPIPENRAPAAVNQLIYPSVDLLCINNTITFQWGASSDPDGDQVSYKITIALDRNLNSIVEQATVFSPSQTFTLQKGVAYYWNVIATDGQDTASPSQTYAFYTEGVGVSNYAPFSAALNSPEIDAFLNSGTVNLSWTGGDTNTGDTLTYDLFFGETTDPPLFQSDLTNQNFDVSTEVTKTYYWKVNTTDDSGVKTIGQIWVFNTN